MRESTKNLIFGALFVLAGVIGQLLFRFEPIRFYSFWIPFTVAILIRDHLKVWFKAMKNKNSPPSN